MMKQKIVVPTTCFLLFLCILRFLIVTREGLSWATYSGSWYGITLYFLYYIGVGIAFLVSLIGAGVLYRPWKVFVKSRSGRPCFIIAGAYLAFRVVLPIAVGWEFLHNSWLGVIFCYIDWLAFKLNAWYMVMYVLFRIFLFFRNFKTIIKRSLRKSTGGDGDDWVFCFLSLFFFWALVVDKNLDWPGVFDFWWGPYFYCLYYMLVGLSGLGVFGYVLIKAFSAVEKTIDQLSEEGHLVSCIFWVLWVLFLGWSLGWEFPFNSWLDVCFTVGNFVLLGCSLIYILVYIWVRIPSVPWKLKGSVVFVLLICLVGLGLYIWVGGWS